MKIRFSSKLISKIVRGKERQLDASKCYDCTRKERRITTATAK